MRSQVWTVPPQAPQDSASAEDAPDVLGTWIWDVTRQSLTCSEEVTDVAGLEPGALDGDPCSFLALLDGDTRRDFCAAMLRRLARGQPFEDWLELRRPDGGMRLVRITGRPFRDTDGDPLWIVGTLTPIRPADDAARGVAWTEPRDRRSAVAAYRHVYDLVPHRSRHG